MTQMKTLHELTHTSDPAINVVRGWLGAAATTVEVLPPSAQRDEVIVALQVTTHSVLGAVAYETGGILIDHGWLRLLGSGHPRLTRDLPSWNKGRSEGFCLVGDDAAGGFFALNGGALGKDFGKVYYFAPDCLEWEPMNIEYSKFVWWCMSERVSKFYEGLRWTSWKEDVSRLSADRCFIWFPPLWTKQGGLDKSHRGDAPAAETWGFSMDTRSQLGIG